MSLCFQIKMVWKFIKARGAIQGRWQMECLCLFKDWRWEMGLFWLGLRLSEMITPHSTQRKSKGPGTLAGLEGGWAGGRLGWPLPLWTDLCPFTGIPPPMPWDQHLVFQPLYSDERRMERKVMGQEKHKNEENITEECSGNGREWLFRNLL